MTRAEALELIASAIQDYLPPKQNAEAVIDALGEALYLEPQVVELEATLRATAKVG